MTKNSDIIKTEIIRVLNENGRTRSTELAKRVIEKVGNEKMVYREISELVQTGEIEKKIHNKTHIEYELINLYESVNNQLKNLHEEIKMIFNEIVDFDNTVKEEDFSHHERLRTVIHMIQIIQSTDGIMKILSFYPAFKKDKMFSQINRKIIDCWKVIMNTITHQPEENFLNDVLANMRITRFDSDNVN